MLERGGEMVSIKLEITAIKKFNRLREEGKFPRQRRNLQPAHGFIFPHVKISNARIKAALNSAKTPPLEHVECVCFIFVKFLIFPKARRGLTHPAACCVTLAVPV